MIPVRIDGGVPSLAGSTFYYGHSIEPLSPIVSREAIQPKGMGDTKDSNRVYGGCNAVRRDFSAD